MEQFTVTAKVITPIKRLRKLVGNGLGLAGEIYYVMKSLSKGGFMPTPGKMGEPIEGGFVLDQPNIQVFERKPKEPKPEAAAV